MRRSSVLLILPACLLILLIISMRAVFAETTIELVTHSGIGSSIVYPQVSGLGDPHICDEINKTIVQKGYINEHLYTLSSITSAGGQGVNVSAEYTLHKGTEGYDVLSVLLKADGVMPGGRLGHVRTPMNFLLSTGKELAASDVFINVQETAAYLDEYISVNIMPGLSSYMENSELTPVPIEHFYLAGSGIMFCYDAKDYSMLSGDSGAVELKYFELKEYLNFKEDGIFSRITVDKLPQVSAETTAKIAMEIENGMLPGLPIKIGEPVQNVIDKYRLLYDPDFYPGGMYFELEDASLRGVRVLTDKQTDDYSLLTVSALRTDRLNLYGLITGFTTRYEWRKTLGDPNEELSYDLDASIEYGVPEGQSDSYIFGTHELTLFANKEGLLAMIQLK